MLIKLTLANTENPAFDRPTYLIGDEYESVYQPVAREPGLSVIKTRDAFSNQQLRKL